MVFDTRDFKADPTYTLGRRIEISYGSLKKLSVDAITFSLFLHSSQILKNKGTFKNVADLSRFIYSALETNP